mgnify:FL=1
MKILQIILAVIIAVNVPFNAIFVNRIAKQEARVIVDDTLVSKISDVRKKLYPVLEDMRQDMAGDRSSITLHYYSDDPYFVSDTAFRFTQPIFAGVLQLTSGPEAPDISYRRQNNSLAGFDQIGLTMNRECVFRTATPIDYVKLVEKWTAGLVIRCPIYDRESNAVVAHMATIYEEVEFDQDFITKQFVIMQSYAPGILEILKDGN